MATLLDPLIDFKHLEAAEAVDHIKRVVIHSTRSYLVDDDDIEDVCDLSFQYDDCWELDGMTRPCTFEAAFRRKPRICIKKTPAGELNMIAGSKRHPEAARVQRALNRWVSLVAAARRRANGCGMTRRQQRLFKDRLRREREHQLGLVEKPTRMPRHGTWLRSPSVEEYEDNFRRSTFSKSKKEANVTNEIKKGKHVFHSRAVVDCDNSTVECTTCGCSSEFDAFGDRLCWCDSCQQSGCSRTSNSQPPATTTHSPGGRWISLSIKFLETHHKTITQQKVRFVRRTPPMVSAIRRWLFIHGPEDKHLALEARLSLYEASRAYELTMSYQVECADQVQQRRQERQVWRRWSRVIRSLHAKNCSNVRRAALHDAASSRRQRGYRSELNFLANASAPISIANTSIAVNIATTSVPVALRAVYDETLAAQLGLDVATYRMLKQLEEREIMPEDYDLLGRLDDAVKPQTLSPGELERFPIHVHCTVASTSSDEKPTEVGFDFWRLPLPALLPEVEMCSHVTVDCVCSSFPFWRLPLPTFDDEDDLSSTAASDGSNENSGVVCGVCLVEFENGDEVRELPCGHCFHRACIDHWLLNASTVCPIDKRDVREL